MTKCLLKHVGISRIARIDINEKCCKKSARIARIARIKNKAVSCVKKYARIVRVDSKKVPSPAILTKKRMFPIYISLVPIRGGERKEKFVRIAGICVSS